MPGHSYCQHCFDKFWQITFSHMMNHVLEFRAANSDNECGAVTTGQENKAIESGPRDQLINLWANAPQWPHPVLPCNPGCWVFATKTSHTHSYYQHVDYSFSPLLKFYFMISPNGKRNTTLILHAILCSFCNSFGSISCAVLLVTVSTTLSHFI